MLRSQTSPRLPMNLLMVRLIVSPSARKSRPVGGSPCFAKDVLLFSMSCSMLESVEIKAEVRVFR